MAAVELAESWDVPGDVASVQVWVGAFFGRHQMWVAGEQPGEVHARQGRRLLARLLGRWSPAGWLPKRAFVRLKRPDAGVAVRAGTEDGRNGGSPTEGFRDAYRAYFEWWRHELRQAIRDPGARPGDPITP